MAIHEVLLPITALSGLFTLIAVYFYYRKDRYEPESPRRLAFAFFLGILSVIPALIGELLVAFIAVLMGFYFLADGIGMAVIIAPFVEEICKALMVIHLSRHRDFDGPLDGLIYGAMVGAGFAMMENILYGITTVVAADLTAGLGLTAIRGATQIIGHPLYTGIIGSGIGGYKVGLFKSKYHNLKRGVGLHMGWNAMATFLEFIPLVGLVLLLVIVVISIQALRTELKFAMTLDQQAFERGYYEKKQEFMKSRAWPMTPPASPSTVLPQASVPPPTVSSPQPFGNPNLQTFITCTNCNNVIKLSSKFCPFCGTKVVPPEATKVQVGACAVCRGPILPGDRACRRCGSSLVSSSPSPVVPSKKVCDVCGNSNSTQARFCRFCGNPMG